MTTDRTPRAAGFTLIELMTACALTALLAGLAIGIARDAEAAATATSREARELHALQDALEALQDDLRQCGATAAEYWSCTAGDGALTRRVPGTAASSYDLPVTGLDFERDGTLVRATLTLAPRRTGRPGATVSVHATPRGLPADQTPEHRR